MCELLGFSANTPTDIRPYLKTFFSHSVKHPHGWGMMREQEEREIIKEPVKALDSKILKNVIDGTPPQTTMLAHIRFATIGRIRYDNCHPFTGTDRFGREWTLIHNGTIYSGKVMMQNLNRQKGDTDSERLFLAMLDRINSQERPMSQPERFALIDAFITETAPRNKLNLMIYDGELLYIHKNMNQTLKYLKLPGAYLFSTTELNDGIWQEFPLAQVMAFYAGKLAFQGQPHQGVFVPTLEYITAMDAMNI